MFEQLENIKQDFLNISKAIDLMTLYLKLL